MIGSNEEEVYSKGGFRSRGRIAQVLAQARVEASQNVTLKDPSRPYTPASYDSRISIDIVHSHESLNPMPSLKNTTNLSNKSFKSLEKQLSINSSSSKENNTKNLKSSSRGSSPKQKISRDNSTDEKQASMQLLLYDIRDLLISMDSLLHQLETIPSKMVVDDDMMKLFVQYGSYLDQLKLLIRDGNSASKLPKDVVTIIDETSLLFMRVLDNSSNNNNNSNSNSITSNSSNKLSILSKLNASRYLIQLQLIILQRHESIESAIILKQSCQALYESLTHNQKDNQMNESRVYSDRKSTTYEVVTNELDQISIFLGILWSRYSSDFNSATSTSINEILSRSVDSTSTLNSNRSNSNNSNNNNNNNSNDSINNAINIFSIYLETALYSIGIIRHHSNSEVNRKRLIHLGLVDSLCQGLHIITSNYHQYHRNHKKISIQTMSTDNIISMTNNIFKQQIMSVIPKILIQITAAIRNFSLDQIGRTSLLNSKIVSPLCQSLLLFKHEPDVQLNILRITAKLSLLEPFRAQINSKPSHIKCFADVIISEAVLAFKHNTDNSGNQKITSNILDSNPRETISWPLWQTWPILSRVGFTLGNLTTSNNANRVLIGMDCKCLKPLVTLLQASAKYLKSYQLSNISTEEWNSKNKQDVSTSTSISSSIRNPSNSNKNRNNYHSNHAYEEDEYTEEEEDSEDMNRNMDIDGNGDGDTDISTDIDDENQNQTNRERELNTSIPNQSDNNSEVISRMHEEVIDASVKLLRLLANISIEESLGKYIASRVEPFQTLLELLPCAENEEELLLNVVATSTNITYYACNAEEEISDEIEHVLLQLVLQLSKCLFHQNDEVVLESARALGNLTRLSSVLPALLSRRVDEALLLLLQHPNLDIVTVVTGTLVNLTRNPTARDSLMLLGVSSTIDPLIHALKRSSLKNISLTTLVCQVLHNLLTSTQEIDSKLKDHNHQGIASPPAVAAMLRKQRISFLSSMPESLHETLLELYDCANDLSNTESSTNDSGRNGRNEEESIEIQYKEFIRVGGLVLEILQMERS